MENRSWLNAVIPPAEITPCGHLTDTPEKFYLSACEDADRLARDIGLRPDSTILDIGCGVGRLPIGLIARNLPFSFYLGTDVSQSRIGWCAENLPPRDGRLHFQFVDMPNERYNPNGCGVAQIPLPPASIDIVNLYSVFSHLREADVRAYLALIAGVLRPGGQCFLTMFVDDGVPPVSENPADFTPLPWSGPLHCVRYNRAHWHMMVEAAGLTVVRELARINPDEQSAFYLAKPRYMQRARTPHAGARPRCLVGIFGLDRNPQVTSPSIRQNILEPLAAAGCDVVTAAHFNCPEVVHSPRSGEIRVPAASAGPPSFAMELCWREPQTAENTAEQLRVLRGYPLRWEDDADGTIRQNALHQLHSLRRLGSLVQTLGPDTFDVFCLLRADLLYVDPMPVADILRLVRGEGVDIVMPNWHHFGGFNDRFAFCSRNGALAYLNRIDAVERFCREHGYFHPETMLRDVIEKARLKTGFIPMRAKRVRATGVVRDEDFAVI